MILKLLLIIGIILPSWASADCEGTLLFVKNQLTKHAATLHYPSPHTAADDNASTLTLSPGESPTICINTNSRISYFTSVDAYGNTHTTSICGPIHDRSTIGIKLNESTGAFPYQIICFTEN